MGRGMDDIHVPDRDARWDKYVQKYEFGDAAYHPVRFYGDVVVDFAHSVKTAKGTYREYCHGFDVDKGEFYPDKKDRCLCCKLEIAGGYRYLMNLIDIEAEENMPAKPKADWTPIRYLDMPVSLFRRLLDLKTINGSYNISNPDKGAIVMIKYDQTMDAANRYSCSLDTKMVPLSEAQRAYTVKQRYPDGSTQIVKGVNNIPAQYEYIRCINSRDDMEKSLRRHGYLESQEHAFDAPQSEDDSMTRKQKIAKLDAEASVETVDLEADLSQVFAPDEEPAPKSKSQVKETPKAATTELAPCDECPTSFGKIANSLECFTKCPVMEQCREASNYQANAATSKKPETVDVEDDDMV
jgi:hypothetical protein